MHPVLSYMQSCTDEMLRLLGNIVEIEWPRQKAAIDRLALFLRDLLSLTRAQTNLVPQQTCGDYVRVEWGRGGEQLLMLCHIDGRSGCVTGSRTRLERLT